RWLRILPAAWTRAGSRWGWSPTSPRCAAAGCSRAKGGQHRPGAPAGQFFAMNAWCPHQGGPLFRGDIEDVNGQHCLVCPLHRYAFSLSDGTASCGLRQSTFECKEEAGQLYIRCPFRLSLQPL
uniref:Rieske domain-containing protein n=1 Tax=Macrostomum lignano TaxID=282301 RepID=A0A1I8HWD7_9PLAT